MTPRRRGVPKRDGRETRMKSVLATANALSDMNRLRVVCVLKGRELCACDIIRMLGLAQATVSRHMGILVQAGLVVGRKDGRWMHYRLAGKPDGNSPQVRDALRWVHAHAGSDPVAARDAERVGGCKNVAASVCECER